MIVDKLAEFVVSPIAKTTLLKHMLLGHENIVRCEASCKGFTFNLLILKYKQLRSSELLLNGKPCA